VEAIRLSSFYRSVAQWPQSELELTEIASQVRALLDVPVAAVWTQELGVRASVRAGGEGTAPSPEAFADVVLRQTRTLYAVGAADPGPLRYLQLSERPGPGHLTLAPITATLRTNGGPRARERRDFGWIAAGTEKPFPVRTETLLVAVAHHLGYLAATAQADAMIAVRDQFLSIASHEFKTPLTWIYGVLQLQERMLRPRPSGPAPTPELERQRSFFAILIRQVERLNELVDALLDVSRIHNGRFVVEPSDVDVVPLLRDTVSGRLSAIAGDAGVSLQVEAPERLVAWVDPVRFEEIVTNLGMNAIRFSPEGGVVWVRLWAEDGTLVLTVRDQGPSIPEDDRDRIFRPFERAQRTGRLGGLGLGLFISREIARLDHGEVRLAESLPGKGNLFEARLPLSAAASSSAFGA
jgi:signal transduction histidine kinase